MSQEKLTRKKRNRRPRIATQKEADKLTEREKFCLDAFMVNGDKRGAYVYSRDKTPEASEDSLVTMSSRWFNSDPIKAYIELNGYSIGVKTDARENSVEERDVVFDRIAELLENHTSNSDPKIAISAAKELANLYQLKSKPQEEAEQRKHYYLLLRCEDCACYKHVRDNDVSVEPNNN